MKDGILEVSTSHENGLLFCPFGFVTKIITFLKLLTKGHKAFAATKETSWKQLWLIKSERVRRHPELIALHIDGLMYFLYLSQEKTVLKRAYFNNKLQ